MGVDGESTLALTARWAAAVRAVESSRADRLYDDPWAAELAGAEGMAWVADRPPGTLATMVLRTRFYDDFVVERTSCAGIDQVVLLAAGLDTRAFRLTWPSATVVYELDRPDVLGRKGAILTAAGATARASRRVCSTDLAAPGWVDDLVAGGFDPAHRALFLAEGFLFYLPAAAISRLLHQVSALAAPGSALGFDIVNAPTLVHPMTKPWVDMQAAAGAPWTGTLDDPLATLAALGWDGTLTQCGEPGADHGRWQLPVVPAGPPGLPHYWLVTATRRG